ncbi:contactin-5-like isoform X1 [Acipenser oxyrinchus oxyrinchus]|uniref:Contactin-5 n=1 Tax=Acipenser oxyrinchus oxyrinchus TaxID=40147 RepID=A0AAD8DEG2_ACIOX|nr:contactin-5-like isoform X1 [Acipenser oxyrinchus oxyrinchus]KAK1169444.1 contactin-5-like isoform X1 [Acipenser oxyrinchus oxyrinchus]
MGSPWKPLLLLSVIGGLSEFCEAVAGRPVSYAALLRIKPDSSSAFLNSKSRPRYSSHRSSASNGWQALSNQHLSSKNAFYLSDAFRQDETQEFGPAFLQEPDNTIFALDSEEKKVVLNCEARGNPSPMYRWLFNGTEIDITIDYRYSLIDGNLIIMNPNEVRDSGKYQCLVTNSFGTIISRDAMLQFAYLGNFSGRTRGAVSVREGQGVVLMCSPPPHAPEITHSWVFNEFPLFVAEDSRRFISQVTGNLYISKVQPSDVGSYICLVKNTVTSARVLSPPTPLTLKTDGIMGEYEPKIEVHFPLTVTAAKGVTVKLECFALGNPVPTISWRKVNGNIPSKARLRKSQAVLEIPNVQLEDSGTYECKAENSRGKNIFRGQLQVYTYPQWIRMINDTQLDSGEQLHWDCKATGKPRPSYRWLWNGAPLLSRNRTEMVNGELLIKSLHQSDAGMYQCVAENKHGAIYSSAALKILASAPSFQPIPERKIVTAIVGKDIILECKPQASPKPDITWKKGDRRIPPNKRISVVEDNSLRIVNSTKSDEGSYVCRGENQFGSAEMTTTVRVKEPTRMQLAPARMEVTVGESVVLNCKAFHDPSLDVSFLWLQNREPINFHKEGGHFENIGAQASSADLMIRNILLKHAGWYGCRVQTSADSLMSEAELLVRGPPGPPGIVIVEEITDTTATLSWSRGVDNHSPISTYNLQARSPFSLGWQTVKTEPDPVTGDMESAMAVDLNPWVEYEFRVVASNGIGTGDPSAPSRVVRTNEAVPSVAPANVSGGSGRRHELVITWEPVSEEFQNGEGFGYIVAFRANGTRGWKEKMVTSADASKFIYRDETVPPLTPFEVKVGVYNNKGDGPFSNIVTVYSAEGEPREAPSDVKAASVSSSEIMVVWRPPNPAPGRPKNYEVNYWKDMEQEESGERMKTPGNETSILLTGLEGNTFYHITVKGYNSAGQGPASTAVRAKTKKSPPSQAPGNLMGIQDGDRVSLGWEAVKPLDNESDVMGYKVLFRQEGQSSSEVIETNISSAVVPLSDGGIYIIEVRAFSEGGEGTASSQIRVPVSSGVRVPNHQSSVHSISSCSATVTILLVFVIPSASW